jgi:hypothetical protein
MEKEKIGYSEARKILARRIQPIATSLGEKMGGKEPFQLNPLSSPNFIIEYRATEVSYCERSDYRKVDLAIITTEYPKVRRRVNGIDIKTGSLDTVKAKMKEIITESIRIRAQKKVEEDTAKNKVKGLMDEFKEFNPKNEEWGISIQVGKIKFEMNHWRDEVKAEFSGDKAELADIIRRLK